jgi:hypothetical protein
MRTKDREFLQEDWRRRFAAVAQRIAEVGELAFVPTPGPGLSLAALRRTVARLRSGAIRPSDPRVSPLLLADLMEMGIEKELLVRWIVAELGGNVALGREIEERGEEERVRRLVAGFHRLKKSCKAEDADSAAAQRLQRLHRERRNELGRPRKK